MSGLTIGVGALRDSSAQSNIREGLLGSAGVGICPGLSNLYMFGLANRLAGRYIPYTELESIMFWPLPLRGIMWLLSTQVNDSALAD